MKSRILFALVLAAGFLTQGAAFAGLTAGDVHCDVESDYSMRIAPERITFTADEGGRVLALTAAGVLEVDGKPLALNAADRALVADLERSIRRIIPQVKSLAADAVAIAYEAVAHVSTAFAANAHEARESAERIARSAEELKDSINARQDWGRSSEHEIEQLIEGSVGALIGEIVGNVTAQAVRVALSDDPSALAELEARAGSIEKNVEQAVESRSRELEARADALCRQVRDLDAIESRISARLPDGAAINLVRIDD
ncbi:MAG: DUF2884 family protein [Dokdonella sp.]|uniref:DUF2884 family protein n=1 Tax=Dokdonella sp. TaxID=2291710 RepID=UPI0025C0A49D|nr:DUF2884 family protein [Dokdonella sp.]MBK8123642.1 DUF2884 family protein [Dokdonella sp.]